MGKQINVALIGNPNTGKTSVFNALTGLNQKVGNYPGITVEKKEGICQLSRSSKAHIIDLPGTYSLNASSVDESVVVELLLNKNDKDFPDVAVLVSDVENLKRNLLLFTQIKDLNIPTILVINMADRMQKKGISLDIEQLEKEFDTKIALISTRKRQGIENLKNLISQYRNLSSESFMEISSLDHSYFNRLKNIYPNQNLYKLWVVISQDVNFNPIPKKELDIETFKTKTKGELKRLQQKEAIKRFQRINEILKKGQTIDLTKATGLRYKIDKILTHKIFGYLIFGAVLLTIFQFIYDWASYPQDFIDESMAYLSQQTRMWLGEGILVDLICDGILSGIAGILIFIPQIAFLFFFIALLEESGYMSRVVFLMDRLMRPFGLSGKSMVPLISGAACAIPAVMATRNIESWKERLITIMVVPFITCAARLPVYYIIIALVIPNGSIIGLNYQALTLMALYIFGFLMALISAFLLQKFLKIKTKSYFIAEMPNYKIPLWRNVLFTIIEKTKTFVFEAGKIIIAISVILYLLASNGPGDNFKKAEEIVTAHNPELNETAVQNKINEHKLKHSYIGILGKTIEPAIKPLGYDWKIGIGLISSFAAREVFISTLATIYSVGDSNEMDEDQAQNTIKNRMANETRANGKKVFDFPTGVSLLLFYAFAMQCLSTLAIVKRETNGWKWPIFQLVGMTAIAYIVALCAYQILS